MTINKFNYEAFALDYLEGNLSPEMVEEMELFLKTHPAIESELSGMMEFVTLKPDVSIVYEEKESLLKSERVVWLQKRWIRPVMAAASIALLLMTYFIGYRAGVNNLETPIVVVDENLNEEQESDVIIGEAIEKTPKANIVKNNSPQNKEAREVKRTLKTHKRINRSNQTIERPSIAREQTVVFNHKNRNDPTEKTPILIINPLPLPPNKAEEMQMEQITTTVLTTLATASPIQLHLNSTTINANDLEHILVADLPLDKEKLAKQLKRKRTFKDFLGKFPVNNLKEALIPSYYREETTGQ